LIDVDNSRYEDLKVSAGKQKYFGKDGLYYCGFFVSPTGAIHEISFEAKKIAKDIANKEKKFDREVVMFQSLQLLMLQNKN
jgi:hypothetical protein